MEVDIGESQVQQLKGRLGELITKQLLQKPDEVLVAELLKDGK